MALATWLLLLLSITYGSALALPFFFDDFVHIPFVDSHSLAEIWRTSGGLAYYRPMSFAIWKVMFLVLGHHDPFAQHALNLALHALNAFMVGWLAGDLFAGQLWLRRFLATSLFLIFPFSYQAVPWVGSMSHLLVTSLILLALVSYRHHGRRGGGRMWALMSLLFSGLAPYAHENGALIGPLVAVIELTAPHGRGGRIRSALRQGVTWSLPALAWLPFWLSAPKIVQADLTMPSLELLTQNAVYFAQGIGYPLTWLGGRIHQSWGANDLLVAALLAAGALAAAAFIQAIRCPDRRAVLPWLWCGLAVMPAALILRFDYVINGPRLLMVASVGAALLWTDTVARFLPKRGKRARTWAMVSLSLLVLGVQNLSFVRERMDLHQRLGGVIEQVVEITSSANRAGRPAVVINFPSWLAPWDAQYAIGHEGVLVWPDYASPDTLVHVHTGEEAHLTLARWDAVRSEIPCHYGVAGEAPDWPALIAGRAEIFVTRYEEDRIEVLPVGAIGTSAPGPDAVARFLDGEGHVVAVLVSASASVRPDGRMLLDLEWQARSVPSDVTVFVHLLDANGATTTQADGDPFGGLLALHQWPDNLVARDMRLVQPTRAVAIRVGLYSRVTGDRVEAVDSLGIEWPDQAVPVMLSIE